MSLQIENISISRPYNFDDTKHYRATVKITGHYQELNLVLPDHLSDQVISLIAPLIVEGSRNVANALTEQALQYASLPAPVKDGEYIPKDSDDDGIPF
jgi:hypothetical protein